MRDIDQETPRDERYELFVPCLDHQLQEVGSELKGVTSAHIGVVDSKADQRNEGLTKL
jgi:hypothetical protein